VEPELLAGVVADAKRRHGLSRAKCLGPMAMTIQGCGQRSEHQEAGCELEASGAGPFLFEHLLNSGRSERTGNLARKRASTLRRASTSSSSVAVLGAPPIPDPVGLPPGPDGGRRRMPSHTAQVSDAHLFGWA
jgi:hypothetical protein